MYAFKIADVIATNSYSSTSAYLVRYLQMLSTCAPSHLVADAAAFFKGVTFFCRGVRPCIMRSDFELQLTQSDATKLDRIFPIRESDDPVTIYDAFYPSDYQIEK